MGVPDAGRGSIKSLRSGHYRYEKPLYVVVSKSAPKAGIDFVNLLRTLDSGTKSGASKSRDRCGRS